jgi:hypothetical protein
MLTVDEEAKAKVKVVTDFAEKPENYYIVEKGGFSLQRPPGDDPRHVTHLDTYRCVFSITKAEDKLWKHLSVSVPNPNAFPNPMATFTIAELFGFTTWTGNPADVPEAWKIQIDGEGHCIVLAQEL